MIYFDRFDVETDESGMMFLSVPDDIADQLLSTLSDADIGGEFLLLSVIWLFTYVLGTSF